MDKPVCALEIEIDASTINELAEQLEQAVVAGLLTEQEALRAADKLLDEELPKLVKLRAVNL